MRIHGGAFGFLPAIMLVAGLFFPPPAFASHLSYPPYVTRFPAPTVKHAVPFHRQEHALSCEAAALRMVILSKGKDISESDIIGKTPTGPMGSDPDLVYVGNIDGRQFLDGYGIHWDALAHVARNYAPAESFHRTDLHYLIDRLHDNGAVMIWGSLLRSPGPASWTTPEGKYIHAVRGEHTFVVVGYAGDRRAPTHIFTLDPLVGERIFKTGDFLRIWSYYNNSGVFLK